MSKAGLLESFLLLTGDGHHHQSSRHLQPPGALPDYTSPPLQVALNATPELYRSDDVVQLARDLDAAGNCTIDGNRCQIPFPVNANKFEGPSRVGVVFYNGGLVDPRGYSPIAALVNERYGMPVVLPIFDSDLPFAFGECDTGRLELAQAEFPEVEKWVLVGHSLGGGAAMTDMWVRWNAMDEAAAGLVLLGSDVQQGFACGDTDFSASGLPMAQVLGSNDGVLNQTTAALNAVYNSNATFDLEIFGANHASFGGYDDSERFDLLGQVDGEALIPDTVVWDLVAAAIANVAARTGVPLPKPKEVMDKCPTVADHSGTTSAMATTATVSLLSYLLTIVLALN